MEHGQVFHDNLSYIKERDTVLIVLPDLNMASFFNNKARAAALAATNGASSSKAAPKEDNRQQPWVEK